MPKVSEIRHKPSPPKRVVTTCIFSGHIKTGKKKRDPGHFSNYRFLHIFFSFLVLMKSFHGCQYNSSSGWALKTGSCKVWCFCNFSINLEKWGGG